MFDYQDGHEYIHRNSFYAYSKKSLIDGVVAEPLFFHVLTLAHMPLETLGRENKEDPWISKPWMHKAAVYFKSRV